MIQQHVYHHSFNQVQQQEAYLPKQIFQPVLAYSCQPIHQDIIDNLLMRYVLTNIGQKTMVTIFSNLLDAYWFYTDYIYTNLVERTKYNLQQITENHFIEQAIFRLQSLRLIPASISPYKLIKSYRTYQMTIPVCGGILINDARTHVLMIQKDNNWSLPKGKVNSIYETYTECAVREIHEEVGYKCPDTPLELVQFMNKIQLNVFFIIKNVPTYYPFHTKVVGEIDRIQWIPIAEVEKYLPYKFQHLSTIIREKASY